jgi:CRISPR system Cascade subunit CasD
MPFLILRLYGPLCSWGGPAVGELRPSADHPGRSAILGLVAAALGLRRDDADGQAALTASFAIAVRVDAAGRRMEDYHTVQAPKARRGFAPATRRQELLAGADHLETMVTRRGYLADAVYTIALAPRTEARWPLETVAEALRRPRFQPYLGRKSCPPALPLAPLVSTAVTLPDALAEADAAWAERDALLAPLLKRDEGARRLLWDADVPDEGLNAHAEILRRDEPTDRMRWQFVERLEREGRLAATPNGEGM